MHSFRKIAWSSGSCAFHTGKRMVRYLKLPPSSTSPPPYIDDGEKPGADIIRKVVLEWVFASLLTPSTEEGSVCPLFMALFNSTIGIYSPLLRISFVPLSVCLSGWLDKVVRHPLTNIVVCKLLNRNATSSFYWEGGGGGQQNHCHAISKLVKFEFVKLN